MSSDKKFEFEFEEERPPLWRRLLPVACILLAVGLAALFPTLRDRYRLWRQGDTLEKAQKFVAARDLPNAALAINNALRRDPGNPELWRFAADLLEQAGDPDAVRVRRHLLDLSGNKPADRYALVHTALRFHDILVARETLEAADESERGTPAYRRAVASLAVASGRPDRADYLLDSLPELAADDAMGRLERLSLALRHAPDARARRAREDLEALATEGEARLAALRELALDAARRGDSGATLARARELAALPEATFLDRLLLANARLFAGETTLPALVPSLGEEALAGPSESIRQFVGWLLSLDRAADALAWLDGLSPARQEEPAVLAARANCQVALHAWPEVGALIKRGAWGPVSDESIQLALAARVLHGMDRDALRDSLWKEALRATASNLNGVLVLHRLALSWGWNAEARQALLALVEAHPDQIWAHQTLARQFHEAGDSAGLRAVFRLWDEAQPRRAYVEGNRLFLDLLGASGTESAKLEETARRLREQQPENPFFITNHAFALWRLGRNEEALNALFIIPPTRLEEPGRSLYLGLVLAGLERREEAAVALARAETARLLPEERKLLRQALIQVRRRPALAAAAEPGTKESAADAAPPEPAAPGSPERPEPGR